MPRALVGARWYESEHNDIRTTNATDTAKSAFAWHANPVPGQPVLYKGEMAIFVGTNSPDMYSVLDVHDQSQRFVSKEHVTLPMSDLDDAKKIKQECDRRAAARRVASTGISQPRFDEESELKHDRFYFLLYLVSDLRGMHQYNAIFVEESTRNSSVEFADALLREAIRTHNAVYEPPEMVRHFVKDNGGIVSLRPGVSGVKLQRPVDIADVAHIVGDTTDELPQTVCLTVASDRMSKREGREFAPGYEISHRSALRPRYIAAGVLLGGMSVVVEASVSRDQDLKMDRVFAYCLLASGVVTIIVLVTSGALPSTVSDSVLPDPTMLISPTK